MCFGFSYEPDTKHMTCGLLVQITELPLPSRTIDYNKIIPFPCFLNL